MSSTDHEDEFDKQFVGFGEDAPTVEAEPTTDEPKPAEEPKKEDEPAEKAEPAPEKPNETDDKPEEKSPEPAKTPEPEAAPEAPAPLSKDDVLSVISDFRNQERDSSKELETTTQEVLDAYYPQGLSNVLIDESTGRELRTPQDVVDASNGEMDIKDAAQWLMNEQYKLDSQITKIKDDARGLADQTVKFKRDSVAVIEKYTPLFKAYPQLQSKVFNSVMKQVKTDDAKGVILSAPDVQEYYDDYLEPYRLAYEYKTSQSATAPVTSDAPAPPPTPTADDRLDDAGDGGATAPNDPTDFAQQVSKELAKGI